MIPIRKNLDGVAIALMMFLCLCWGLQQVAVKLAAPVISSSFQLGLRSALAAILVTGLILVRRIPFSLTDGTFKPGVLAAALFSAEFLCISLGLNYTSASHMSVFLYTAPIFTVIGLHRLIPSERMQRSQWLGIGFAFAGIAVAFSAAFSKEVSNNDYALSKMLIGDALGIVAGILWAATTVVIRRSKLSEAQPTTTLLYQLVGAAVVLLPYALLQGELGNLQAIAWVQSWDSSIWLNLLFQSVVIAFVSYLTWFWLMRRYLVSRLSVFSFLTPLFGVAAGVVLMHDPVSVRFAVGALLVLAGIVLVNRRTSTLS
ncbi:DMT family transporter [soil metagenome]